MNCYFVFEGKTEPIVYKKWLSVLLPHLKEVDSFDAVTKNTYYAESDMGVPDCYNVVADAVQEINEFPRYDYLVLFTDADRFNVEEKREEAYNSISEKLSDVEKGYAYKELPFNCQLVVIVQKVCIETWFLGNRKFFIRKPQSELLQKYIDYFDVSSDNPEELAGEFVQDSENGKEIFGYKTKATFHEGYLRELFKEQNLVRTSRCSPPSRHLVYNKPKPMEVQEPYFLEQISTRIKDNPSHLLSFQEFIRFCEMLNQNKKAT